jgi:hypothetical protein
MDYFPPLSGSTAYKPLHSGHTYSIRIEWSRDENRPTIDGQFMDLRGLNNGDISESDAIIYEPTT